MIDFVIEWTVRSSILIAVGALLLGASRIRDTSLRLAAWTAMLVGSLLIPFAGGALPRVSLPVKRAETPRPAAAPVAVYAGSAPPIEEMRREEMPAVASPSEAAAVARPFDWFLATNVIYAAVCGVMLLRVLIGLIGSLRLLRRSRKTEIAGVRESEHVGAPVTLGIWRPTVVLPVDWREWGHVKLDAVLAHERSHIQRYDPAVQLLSALHRALLWINPLGWFLHSMIVRTAEEASDDAAVMATRDRAVYAEVLLEFMQRGVWTAGVPMARYGRADARINRILDGTVLSRGVTRKSLAAILLVGSPLAYVVATAQAQNPPQAGTQVAQAPAPVATPRRSTGPAFDVADVHAIPYTNQNRTMYGGFLRDVRYELRHATILDLIKTAYGVDADTVTGGPSWLDWDRFDVIATAPPSTSPQTVRLMLQSLLEDRFGLAIHRDTRPMPAFVVSMGKGKPKLKEADGSGDTGCRFVPRPPEPGVIPNIEITCRNTSMEEFAQSLRGMDQAPPNSYLNDPVVDSTGLKGSWDFDIQWTPQAYLRLAGSDGITLFEAIDKQLGLKLEPKTVPLPVIVVDNASEKPTANAPGVASLPPAPEFEVASLRPSPPDARPLLELLPGGRVTMRSQPLDLLIRWAWRDEVIVGMPKWISPFGPAFDLVAKVSTSANAPPFELNEIDLMVRTLLVDRFKMVTHYEDRPADAYTLVAAKPKLTRADPSNRSGCKRERGRVPGQPDDAPPMGNILTCRNLTMAQFAEWIGSWMESYPILDATGLAGGWDFTLTWGTFGGAGGGGRKGGPSPSVGANGVASEPEGGVSLTDAVEKQLGLKLEKHQRPEPVLVIDHMEEKAVEN